MQAKEKQGIEIEAVAGGSPAERAGIKAGDSLVRVNGSRVTDLIDYLFEKGETSLELEVRSGPKGQLKTLTCEGEDPGIELAHFPVKRCRNKCVFCFVAQLPRGLRKTLYVKDEDYRMSFLYGNYITMTNLTEKDKKRIAAQKLGPLYISVHSTDKKTRNRLLGNPDAADIMEELRFLKKNRIRSHVQIVLCPGHNDGADLKNTVRELYSLYPYVASIAVVPLGLTAHRKKELRPVLMEDAEKALEIIEAFQKRFRKKHGDTILYAADELYIKAEAPFPPLADYGELPQIENGVGLVPLFMHEARRAKAKPSTPGLRFLTFTGSSFYPYLKKHLAEKLKRQGAELTVVPVENRFFGNSVTVTGLLTGRDVLHSLAGEAGAHDILLVPDVVLREGGDLFLDDVKVSDLEGALGLKTAVFEASPDGLVRAMESV